MQIPHPLNDLSGGRFDARDSICLKRDGNNSNKI